MWSWWSLLSIDVLSKVNTYAQYAIVVFGILTAVATLISVLSADRISALKDAELTLIKNEQSASDKALRSAQAALKDLRDSQAPRVITAAQRERFMKSLQDVSKGDIGITTVVGDNESMQLAVQLEGMLKEAGFTTTGVSQAIFTPSPVGLFLKVRSADSVPVYAAPLQYTLDAIGLNAPGQVDPGMAAHIVTIVVGHKPPIHN